MVKWFKNLFNKDAKPSFEEQFREHVQTYGELPRTELVEPTRPVFALKAEECELIWSKLYAIGNNIRNFRDMPDWTKEVEPDAIQDSLDRLSEIRTLLWRSWPVEIREPITKKSHTQLIKDATKEEKKT